MKFNRGTYNRISEEASLLSMTASQLSLAFELDDKEHLKDKELLSGYEERQLVLIKDSIARIYATLELWEVEGHIDHAFEHKGEEK
ncbi:hypothetical protein FJQ98_16060 [Lysinibacillus agricola]|uniref:Uncharacterized protein n=1 Tax=Lysinibacillus agricola TaxID=2590012 RepID=A0ABX7ANH5_9BACI|nr:MULTISPECIES: hypothetical protein [Lysinibacillus]KOS61543.1 hypothetical protein AN161_18310 [Lysinibacillus sp. FJAT-14222]QQP10760.1 hypothetical protein FJQ98_16060 [Lysinibacillus agricola]